MTMVCYRVEQLGLNVALQLLVGVPLEMVHGATRIGLVYVAGVVAGRQEGPVVLVPKEGQRRSHGWYKPRLPGHTQIPISRVPDLELSIRHISHSYPDRGCVFWKEGRAYDWNRPTDRVSAIRLPCSSCESLGKFLGPFWSH